MATAVLSGFLRWECGNQKDWTLLGIVIILEYSLYLNTILGMLVKQCHKPKRLSLLVSSLLESSLMFGKQCHEPPVRGNNKHTTYVFMVMTGGWFMALFYHHYLEMGSILAIVNLSTMNIVMYGL